MALSKDALADYLLQNFGLERDQVGEAAPLFSDGLLDSFHLLDLVSFLEAQEGIKVKPLEVNLDNLDSIERILRFLQTKRGR